MLNDTIRKKVVVVAILVNLYRLYFSHFKIVVLLALYFYVYIQMDND